MRKLTMVLLAGIFLTGWDSNAQSAPANTLTAKEKQEGWKLLFDGKTTAGWHNFNSKQIGAAWVVMDESLMLDPAIKKAQGGGSIITDAEYGNYEFSVDWKISTCGNSGIIFNVVEDPKYNEVWKTGPEMQVLDNCHPDGKIPKHRAGNLYDLIASTTESVKPGGEWNQAKIISNKGHLELWLNNVKQVETEMFTPGWEALIKGSKFKDLPDFGKAKMGHIALQDHNDQVWFRNIKIREIK